MNNGTWGGWGYECDICGAEMNQHGQHYHTENCPHSEKHKEKKALTEQKTNEKQKNHFIKLNEKNVNEQ
jgi:hypothetical protein